MDLLKIGLGYVHFFLPKQAKTVFLPMAWTAFLSFWK